MPERVKPSFVILTSGHSDAQGWASVSGCQNYKWRLNPVWHRVLYSCTHVATVGVKGLVYAGTFWPAVNSNVGVLADSFIDTSVTQSCRQRTPRCLNDLRHDSSDVVTSTLRGFRKNSTVSSLWLMTAQSRCGCWNHLLYSPSHHVIIQSSVCIRGFITGWAI